MSKKLPNGLKSPLPAVPTDASIGGERPRASLEGEVHHRLRWDKPRTAEETRHLPRERLTRVMKLSLVHQHMVA